MGKSIDAMVLSGLALAFSRLIDDSVVVIENVYRHLEMGEEPRSRRKREPTKSPWPSWPSCSSPWLCFFRSPFFSE